MAFPGNSGTNIFGSGTSNNNAKPPGSIFGTTNTGSSLFGNTTSTTPNIFGANSNTSSDPNAKPPGSIFGTTSTGSSLFGNANSATSTTPNIFGANPNPSSNTNAKPPGGIFGTANTGSSLFGNASNTTSTTQNLFGANSNTSTTPAGGLFGGGNPSSTPNTMNSGLAGSGLSGGLESATKPPASNFFSLGNTSGTTPAGGTTAGNSLFNLSKPATTAGASNITSTNTTSTPGTSSSTTGSNLFGGAGLFGITPPTLANNSTTTQPVSSTLGSGLFGLKSDEGKKDSTQASTQPFALFATGNKDASAASTTTKEGEKKDTLALSVAVAPPSMLRGKTLEEIINKWTADLDANVGEFNTFAAEVAVWDRALIENGNNIASLYSHVLAAEKQQSEINDALSHIEQQQRDLASTLDAYEKISQEILGGQGSTLRALDTGPADNERDKNYMLATDLHTHLDDLSGSLTQMIDSVNALSIPSKSEDSTDDPMTQITQILSSHLESLQWIDSAVREVESKAYEVEKRVSHSLSGSGLKSRTGRT